MTEVSETELSNLLSKSAEAIKEYVLAHPELLYKGVPLAFIVWMTFPLWAFAWTWLPWFLASYEIYKRLPSGSLSWAYEAIPSHENLFELLKKLGKT